MAHGIRLAVRGVGLIAEGLADWAHAQTVLRGERDWQSAPLVTPAPEVLPPTERRRAAGVIRLAVDCAQQAVSASGIAARRLGSIFATADADADNTHAICEALCAERPALSPTRFHNSVQNAVSGYWSIGTGSRAATTTLLAGDSVFAQALAEAGAQLAIDGEPLLLVCYDLPMPAPLHRSHPVEAGAAVALVLDHAARGTDAPRLSIMLQPRSARDEPAAGLPAPALERLRLASPPGRALPLLASLAGANSAATLRLDYDDHHWLRIERS